MSIGQAVLPHAPSVAAPADCLVKALAEVPSASIEQFVRESGNGWLCHLRPWAQIAEAVFGRQDLSLALLQGGRLVGLCPLALKRTWGFRVLESAAFGGYGGPLIAETLPPSSQAEIARMMMTHIEVTARRHAVDQIQALPFPGMLDGSGWPSAWCEAAGFRARGHDLYLVDVTQPLEVLHQRCAQNVRHAIGQARRFGVRVTREESPASVDTFYTLFLEAHWRSRADILPREYFVRLCQSWGSHGRLFHVFVASHGGRPVAASLVAAWKDWAVYWSNGSSADGLQVRANNLLQWEMICWLKAQGVRWYELGRETPGFISDKQRRIDFFKTRFGVIHQPGLTWIRDLRPWRASVYATLRPWATRLRR